MVNEVGGRPEMVLKVPAEEVSEAAQLGTVKGEDLLAEQARREQEEAARELKARRHGIHAVSRPTGSIASQPQRGTARRSRRTLAPCYLTSTVA